MDSERQTARFIPDPEKQVYRPDIDGLRAVAVVSVVLYHAKILNITGGYVGVDVFFVISGFLIAGILRDDLAAGRFSILGFYERRARRILPALITVILVCFCVAAIIASPHTFVGFAESAAAAAIFLSNVWFSWSTSSYFAPDVELEPLLHTWSLAVEEQFYIVFPLLLWTLFARPRQVLIWVVAAICLTSFSLSVWNVHAAPASAFYLAPSRAWELGVGVLLAIGPVPVSNRIWLREMIAVLGLMAILSAVFFYDDDTPFPGQAALLPCFGTAMLIWSGNKSQTRIGKLLSLRPLVFVGLISYSLYLWHWPILAFLRHYLSTLTLPATVAAGAVVASFALAVVSWVCIERPFRRRPPEGFSQRVIFVNSAAGVATSVILAIGIVHMNGLPERFSPEVKVAFAAANEGSKLRQRCFDRRPEVGLCRVGAPTDPEVPSDFLLWGDSHALAILPGIDVAAREAGRSGLFVGHSACPPLVGVDRADKPADHDCGAFNSAVIAMLSDRKDIPLVILAGRWALAAEGHRPPGEGGRPAILSRVGTKPPPTEPAGNFDLFREGLTETIVAVRATSRKVILIGGVPEIGWNVPHKLGSHLHWGKALPRPPTLDEIAQRNARVDGVLARLADSEGVRHLAIGPRLCTPECRVNDGGRPLYRDGNHLSRFGAIAIIAPLFGEKVWKAHTNTPFTLHALENLE